MNVLRSVSHVRPARAARPRTPPDHEKAARRGRRARHAPRPRRAGARPSTSGRRFAGRRPILLFGLDDARSAIVVLAALTIGLGFLLVDVLLPIHALGRDDEAVNEWLAADRSSSLNDASYVGSMIGDIPFIPALVIAHGARRCHPPPLARVRASSSARSRRARDLPRHEPARAPRPADGAAPRSGAPARQPELPVGPRGGLGRGLRRPRAADLVARARSPADGRRLDRSRSRFRSIVAALAHVPRHAPPDRRRRRRPDRTRGAGHRAARRAAAGEAARRRSHATDAKARHDPRRSHRPSRQDPRRGLAGAAPRARASRRDGPVLARGAEEPLRAREVRKALAERRRAVFVWGGDGMVQRCVDVLAGTKATRRDHPRRHGEPAGHQPRHPEGHRGGGRRSASAGTPRASTSGGSTASASP